LSYRFKLDGRATIFVAKPTDQKLDWLATDGFKPTGQTLTVGHWGWPYRYQNRPPTQTHQFDIWSKNFPAGEVALGPNPKKGQLPYIVFVKPSLLAYENFRRGTSAWQTSGCASIVKVLDYDAEMRPSVFDLSTVPRYRVLDLRALKLEAGASAELKFAAPAKDDFVLHARVKCDQRATLALGVIEVPLKGTGRWQNVTLRVSPSQRKYSVEVQDDSLKIVKNSNRTIPDGSLDRLKFTHTGAEFLCNTVQAYCQ
jgi:transposase